MAKIIDITDKLTLDERPKIKVKGTVLEVNNDAATAMQILQIVDYNLNNVPYDKAFRMAALLFDEKAMNSIKKLKLSFEDYTTLVFTALGTVFGGDDDEGEDQTHTTT